MSWRAGVHVCRVCGYLRPSLSRWTSRSLASSARTPVTMGGRRWLRTSSVMETTAGEKRINALLTDKLTPTYLEVRDISGGCGSMYEIWIDSEVFKGKRLVQQHRMVNEAMSDEMKSLHGLTIRIGRPDQT